MKNKILKTIIMCMIITLLACTVMAQGENKQQAQTQVQGLEDTKLHYENSIQQQSMQKTLSHIELQQRTRLQEQVHNLTFEMIDTELIAKGTQEAKFLGLFKAQKKVQYKINTDGSVELQKRWTYILWKVEDKINNE